MTDAILKILEECSGLLPGETRLYKVEIGRMPDSVVISGGVYNATRKCIGILIVENVGLFSKQWRLRVLAFGGLRVETQEEDLLNPLISLITQLALEFPSRQ